MTLMEKIAAENRERVSKLMEDMIEAVAHRSKLNLSIPSEWMTACSRACAEDRELYNLYRRVMSVPVREVSLTS
jgi:hypothetical protein